MTTIFRTKLYEIGTYRPEWSGKGSLLYHRRYFRDALSSDLKGQNPITKETPAVGCFIERQG